MSSTARARRGGQPSITTPRPGPWDSPKVVMRNSVPKLLPIARQCKSSGYPDARHVGLRGYRVWSYARATLMVDPDRRPTAQEIEELIDLVRRDPSSPAFID